MRHLMLSDRHKCPDWRAALDATLSTGNTGLVLRDYDAPNRAGLAAAMAAYCAERQIYFAIAGDIRLAHAHGAAFHCPSYLLARPAARLAPPAPDDSAAVHNGAEILAAARGGFSTVFLSPIFTTSSHPHARPLGILAAQRLARTARRLNLRVIALGGMDARKLHRLDPNGAVFDGFAAIDAFASS